MSLDLQKLLIFEWTSFSFCLADPELRIDLILLTKFNAGLSRTCSFKCSPCIPRELCAILLLLIIPSEDSGNKLFNLLIVRAAFPWSSLSFVEGNAIWQFGLGSEPDLTVYRKSKMIFHLTNCWYPNIKLKRLVFYLNNGIRLKHMVSIGAPLKHLTFNWFKVCRDTFLVDSINCRVPCY